MDSRNIKFEHLPVHQHIHLYSKVTHYVTVFMRKIEQMQIAIVLSEAGDLEGARSILAKDIKVP